MEQPSWLLGVRRQGHMVRLATAAVLALNLVTGPTRSLAARSLPRVATPPVRSRGFATDRRARTHFTPSALPGTLLVVQYRGFNLCCPDGGQVLAITGGRTSVFLKQMTRGAPAVSPDHRIVAFGRDTLYVIDANGTRFRRVIPPAISPCQNPLAVSDVVWSPNGHMLAYRVVLDSDAIRPCPTGVRDTPGIWVADLHHPHPVQIPLDGAFTWGPSDDSLTVGGTTFDLRTRTTHILVRGLGGSGLAVAPRSRQVAYVTEARGNRSIVSVMQPNGRSRRQLGSIRGSVSGLQWSPDERSLAFFESSAISARGSVCVIDVAHRTYRRLVSVRADLSEPTWSPDSRWVAYLTDRPGAGGPSAVWVVSAGGGAHRRLMHAAGGTDTPGSTLLISHGSEAEHTASALSDNAESRTSGCGVTVPCMGV